MARVRLYEDSAIGYLNDINDTVEKQKKIFIGFSVMASLFIVGKLIIKILLQF